MRLRLTLSFNGANVGQALGRFRLSSTADAEPFRAVSISAHVRDFLSIDPKVRTPDQENAVRSAYRAQCAELASERDRIDTVKKELADLGIISALVMKERQSYERPSTPFRERGAFLAPGDRVYTATPAVLPSMGNDEMPNRLGLARWLVKPTNPLTARVTVNRAWEQFFGRGLVETSEDFGTQGAAPTHPELLDWLATEFVQLRWSQKALHRLIVTSAAYRQDARATPALLTKDPNNRLIARGPRFRMEAEMVRDVTLAAAAYNAGPGAVARARLAADVVAKRLTTMGIVASDVRYDLIGVDALHGGASVSARRLGAPACFPTNQRASGTTRIATRSG